MRIMKPTIISKPKRILDRATLVQALRWRQHTLYKYLSSKHSNRFSREAGDVAVEELARRSFSLQLCNNAYTRLAYLDAILAEIKSPVQISRFWSLITLAPGEYMVTAGEAVRFDPEIIKNSVAPYLAKFNHLGIVEMAFYPRYGGLDDLYSFHIHALVWGLPKHNLHETGVRLEQAFPAYFPHMQSADCRAKGPATVLRSMAYLLKPPIKAYRPYVNRGKVGQNKSWMHAGQLMKSIIAMSDLTMPELLFAGGEGVGLLARVNERARRLLANDPVSFSD